MIRPATHDDASAIREIYSHEVLHGLASFEEEVPSLDHMIQRMDAITTLGLPYLVAEHHGQIAGYAYAGPYRPRPAYRYTVENSVYISQSSRGQGIGKALLQDLMTQCKTAGIRQMIAVIGDSGNAGSIALHSSMDFTHTGTLKSVGFKHDQWVDSVLMQKTL